MHRQSGVLVLAGLSALSAFVAAPAAAQEMGDPVKGLAYAKKVCAECHAVGRDEEVSPDPYAPTFRVAANTPGMTGTALVVWLQSPHPSMPQIMVPDEVRNDLIEYILSLKDKR
jgi:mono/diheme cytochrome c family protein